MLKNNQKFAQFGLVLTTLAWGATFVLVKEGLNDAPPFAFAGYRFLIASLCMIPFVYKKILNVKKDELIGSIYCGIFLFLGYAFQNFGLWENDIYLSTTPSKSAFITSISILFVPLMLLFIPSQKISFRIWAGICLATVGLYLLLDPIVNGISTGDFLTFGCAICFAIHIIIQDRYAKSKINLARFFFFQVLTVTILSFLCTSIVEHQTINWSIQLINALLLTGIIATTIAIILMLWAQKILNPSETALIFSLEPVFAAIFSWFLLNEILNNQEIVGGILVVFSVGWAEGNSNNNHNS